MYYIYMATSSQELELEICQELLILGIEKGT